MTESGPSGPILITKILENVLENYGGILETYSFHICESELLNIWKVRVPIF